jgi:hypothetical protein
MRVILQTWCLIQRRPSGLRYINCVPGHIQCISSSIHWDFNIRLNVSARLFEIIGHYDARYTANWVENIAHILQFTLRELWSRTYTMHLQLRIFSASIFNWTYLRSNCRYHDNSRHVILPTWCQIQRTSSSFRYVNSDQGHIQCIYSSAYSGLNIQLDVSALLLQISRQFNVRYTAKLLPNTAHIVQFTLCELWSRPYTKYLQLRIFSPQYSTERICAAITDIATIQCALYCKIVAKYSTHRSVYAMWTLVQAIYKVFTAPHN